MIKLQIGTGKGSLRVSRLIACSNVVHRASVCVRASGNRFVSTFDHDEVWDRLLLVKRQLSVAVNEEDYTKAAQLRDESKVLTEMLPPVKQYMFHQVELLKSGTPEQKLKAAISLGEAGDDAVVPDLAVCLHDNALQGYAQDALWQIFQRHRDPKVNELLAEGARYMNQGDHARALQAFDEITRTHPSFAEGFNKRATVLYLMQRYQESIEDCKLVLELQPYHFGAAAGMGLCYAQAREYDEALKAFELALKIHPGLTNITRFIEDIKAKREADAKPNFDSEGGVGL